MLGLAQHYFDDAAVKIDRLVSVYPTQSQLTAYFKALYPDDEGKENTRAAGIRAELHRLFEEGVGHDMPQIRSTVRTAFNAVTEFVDHRKIRGADDRDRASRRLASVWFGQGARLKEKAWGLALEMAGVN